MSRSRTGAVWVLMLGWGLVLAGCGGPSALDPEQAKAGEVQRAKVLDKYKAAQQKHQPKALKGRPKR